MFTRGSARALFGLTGACLLALTVGLSALADDGGRQGPPESRSEGTDVRIARPASADQRLDVLGVFDENGKPVEPAALVVKIEEAVAAKTAMSRNGRRYRADLPSVVRKVVIEVESANGGGSVGVTLNPGPLTELGLYIVDGVVTAKLRPAPGGVLSGGPQMAGGGIAGVGDCCMGNGTPGCEDDACEAAVCACDAFCCDTEWDDLCAGEGFVPGCGAAILCADLCDDGGGGGGNDPGADSCADAVAIDGEGTFDFDNGMATTDGVENDACDDFGSAQIDNDVWFCWTAPDDCTGSVRLETCGLTAVDTRMAVYDGCGCPEGLGILACNDDDCGLQSGLSFDAVGGQQYLIRIGTFPGAEGGIGQFSIDCPGGGGGGGGTDNCADGPEEIAGEGTFNFDNSGATTDGPPDKLCLDFGSDQVESDVWFCWTAECDGDVRLETCGQTAVDTKIAVYDGCACDAPILGCNDDTCGLQSRVTWTAAAGSTYLIRIGTFPGAAGGPGTFSIDCIVSKTICEQPPENCQDFAVDNASQSNTTGFTSADDFAVGAGDISGVCWWGEYLPGLDEDEFVITYYNDAGGIPGDVIGGPFTQGIGLAVSGPVDTGQLVAGIAPIWEYTGSHDPVSVDGGCYWIEIRNDSTPNTDWFWEWSFAGNNRVVVDAGPNGYDFGDITVGNDFAFCLDVALGVPDNCLPPPPGNDDCSDADDIAGEGTFPFNNGDATTDGPPSEACVAFGSDQVDNDVWFCWTAPCSSQVVFETCGLTGVDTKIAVYDGCACDALGEPLACNDDACGLQSQVLFDAVAGQSYTLRVGTFPGAMGGAGAFSMTCVAAPENDDCADAAAVDIPSQTPGTTLFASPDDAPFCGTTVDGPGVWYSVTGTGTTITASFCPQFDSDCCFANGTPGCDDADCEGTVCGVDAFCCDTEWDGICAGAAADLCGDLCELAGGGEADYDTKMHVYCGDCDTLICVDGNDDACGVASEVSWCSQAGAEYLIFVSGFGGGTGNFVLSTTEDGVDCTADVGCAITGACCIGADCVDSLTFEGCLFAGGEYQGDGTVCAGGFAGYTEFGECDFAYGPIVGNPGPTGDDAGVVVPLGFSFPFYGNTYTEIGISTNGYLTFGGTLGDFSNDPIPSPAEPNDLIAPYWDDFNLNDGGEIIYNTFAGPQRFMCEWRNVPEFGSGGANTATFQAILFPDGRIQYRYGDIACCDAPGDVTVGIENIDGTDGVSVDHLGLGSGDCITVEPVFEDPIECGFEDCNENGIPDDIELLPEYDPADAELADDCVDADFVGTDIVYTDNTYAATSDASILCDLAWSEYDGYYKYRPASDGTAAFKVCNYDFGGPEYNPIISVHAGCPASEDNQLACNFNSSVGQNCVVILPVEAGVTYWIRIAGEGDSRGWFEFEIKGPRELVNPDDLNDNGELDECECLGDVNGDGWVDGVDFNQVYYLLGTTCYGCDEDLNADDIVDEQDLAILVARYGPCPFDGDDGGKAAGVPGGPAQPDSAGPTRR